MKLVEIKNAKSLEIIPKNEHNEGLKEAYQDAIKHFWTKEETIINTITTFYIIS